MKSKAIIHEAQEGGYWAEVPSLPGCVTQGETMEELRANLHEAIEGWLLAAGCWRVSRNRGICSRDSAKQGVAGAESAKPRNNKQQTQPSHFVRRHRQASAPAIRRRVLSNRNVLGGMY